MRRHAAHRPGHEAVRDPFAGIALLPFLSKNARAACAGQDPELWFDGDNDEAKRICRTCPIQQSCGEWALENREWGVWAGAGSGSRRIGRKPSTRVVECGHYNRPHYAHGLCEPCYRDDYMTNACTECGRVKPIQGLGRCGACASRIYRAAS